MKIQSINNTSFKSFIHQDRHVYFDYPVPFDKLPQGQMSAIHAFNRTMNGTGIVSDPCPRTDIFKQGWESYASPSDKVNVIDIALIKNAKLSKITEKNLFGTPRTKQEFKFDIAVILGGFYDKDWLSNYDIAVLNKYKKIFPMEKLLEKIQEGLEFAKINITPKQKGIFRL